MKLLHLTVSVNDIFRSKTSFEKYKLLATVNHREIKITKSLLLPVETSEICKIIHHDLWVYYFPKCVT